MTFVSYDPGQKKMFFDERKDRVPTAWYADGQLLANYYGENPMEQGRDFARCIGDVKNPGWEKDKGYMKDVESFFVTVVHGREPGSLRNAMWLSLVPGVTKTAVDSFGNPAISTEVASIPVATPTPPAPAPKSDGGGCSCSTPGQQTSSNFIGLVLLGLAIGGIATRRRS
jgi:MYXO-CTERM domain-containing protein